MMGAELGRDHRLCIVFSGGFSSCSLTDLPLEPFLFLILNFVTLTPTFHLADLPSTLTSSL